MPSILLHETDYKLGGKVKRRICFASEGEGKATEYIVWDQHLVENPKSKLMEWITGFILQFPNRDIARTTYMGRITTAAYEEWGSNDDVSETIKYAQPNYQR